MLSIVGAVLAGIGLFFTGLRLVGDNLRQLTSRRFRALFSRFTYNDGLAGLWGAFLGAVTQSASGVTFIIASLVSSGLLTVRRAMPITSWAGVGLSTLILLTVIDIEVLELYLLGVAGLAFAFERPYRWRHFVGAVFGIALLLFGLHQMSEAAAHLKDFDWFQHAVRSVEGTRGPAFFVGIVLTVLSQSSVAVCVVAIEMTRTGLLHLDQTLLIVYGANIGESLITWFLSRSLRGTPRQLAMFQVANDPIGAAIFLPLYILEFNFHIPILVPFLGMFSSRVDQQIAILYLLYNLTIAVVLACFYNQTARLLERWFPPTAEEDESKAVYLQETSLSDPETAIDLAEKEQLRLLKRLPRYMDCARGEGELGPLTRAFEAVAVEIEEFLTALVDRSTDHGTSERLLNVLNRQTLIMNTESNLSKMVEVVLSLQGGPMSTLSESFVEGLDAILMAVADPFETGEETDIELLMTITADRGPLMERLRSNYLSGEGTLELSEKSTLFYLTTLFERTVWLSNRLGQLLLETQRSQSKRLKRSQSVVTGRADHE